MHNLAANVNGRTKSFQGDLHNIDRAHHSGAKASRLEQQNPFLAGGRRGVVTVRDGIKQRCGHISQYTNATTEGTEDKGNRTEPYFAQRAPGQPRPAGLPARVPSRLRLRALVRYAPGVPGWGLDTASSTVRLRQVRLGLSAQGNNLNLASSQRWSPAALRAALP